MRRATETNRQTIRRWRKQIRRIYKETVYVFETRYVFREVEKMFRDNKRLNSEGGFVYDWLRGMWGRDALMAVRRELDGRSGVLNLVKLLHEIENNPKVLSRRGYVQFFGPKYNLPREVPHEQFDRMAGKGKFIGPAIVRADRTKLQADAEVAFRYAQQVVAHRMPATLPGLKIRDINRALDAVESCLKKYFTLLTASGLSGAEPAIQFDWEVVFTYPWMPGPHSTDD